MKIYQYVSFVILAALLLSSCGTTPEAQEQVAVAPVNASDEQTITIGVVSDDPADKIATFQPLADYLAQHLADQNILAGRVVVTATLDDMSAKLKTGEVDLYLESPYGAVQAYEQAGAVPLLRRWKGGISEYYGVIIALKSSNFNGLSGLRGKMVAFEDPTSTTGYFLPKALVLSRGMNMTEKTEAGSSVGAEEVGYFFAGSNENALALLLAKRIDAVAMQFDDYEEFSEAQREQTEIIGKTQSVPRHIVMASPLLNGSLMEAISSVLLGMENSEAGLAMLELTEATTRFDQFPPLGPERTMAELVELFSVGD